jgi:hypothetical protein
LLVAVDERRRVAEFGVTLVRPVASGIYDKGVQLTATSK